MTPDGSVQDESDETGRLSENATDRSRCADGGSAARIVVQVKDTRHGKIPTIRDTDAPSGFRGNTDAERVLLVDNKTKFEEILHSLDTEDAEHNEVLGHFEVADGDFEWCPRSEEVTRNHD